jgi:ABC-2 type transport system permease protein
MRLYLALGRLALQEALQYRVEAAIWFLYDVGPPIMMACVWLAAYEGQALVAGYTLGEMLVYTVGVMVLRTMLTSHIEWGMDWEIRQGLLSTYLVRPFSVWGFWFMGEGAWKVVRGMLIVPVLLVCAAWLGPLVGTVTLSLEQLPLFALSLVLGYVVCFFMKLCIGFIGFWTNDIGGPATFYEVTASVLGGVLVPLALLPGPLQTAAAFLPIQAVYSVPMILLLGKGDGAHPWTGLLVQAGWIVVLWALGLVLWRAGLRRYESVGG